MFNLTGAVTAVGDSAAYSNTTGILTAIGEFALTSNTTGSGTAVGWCAGYSQTTATGCIYLGHQAGYSNGTSNKLFITNTAANPFLEGTIDTSSTTGTLALRGSFLPSAHNTYNLGSDAVRWDAVYCQDGAFNGSDERLKENIAPTFGTSFVVAMADAAIQYKWKDWEYEEEIPDGEEEYEEIVTEMVEVSQLDEEGSPVLDDDGNPVMVTEEQERTETRTRPITKTDTKYVTYRRHHHGFGAQTVKAILDALEIDTTEFAGYAYNPETDSYSIRASEFIPPLYRAFKELHDRITALEGA